MNDRYDSPMISDEIQSLIVQRLGERDRKARRMDEMKVAKNKRLVSRTLTIVAAVACLVGVMFVLPTTEVSPLEELNIQLGSIVSRGASPEMTEIKRLIDAKNYNDALTIAKQELAKSDRELSEWNEITLYSDDEEMDYEEHFEYVRNSELRWTYIYLLVQCERNKEAIKHLKIYIKRPFCCENLEEAKSLLKFLKEK